MAKTITPRDPRAPPQPGSFFVRFPIKAARLRELWSTRTSLKRIGTELGCGTSTIVRGARELGLPMRQDTIQRVQHVVEIRRVRGPTIERFETEALPVPRDLLVAERPPGECQWPLTDSRPWAFCGEKCGSSIYCERHTRLAKGADSDS